MAKPKTTHHCPKDNRGQGNCRKALRTALRKRLYCPAHQTYCPHKDCDDRVHLKTELCVKCVTRKATEEREKKEEEKKRKEKAEVDKKKASMAQSERDRNMKNKKK
ncbi:hypothetical protein L207DRAFT_585152 [Hyaloscypha variabilis F]|uniref:Uncharacterized protein n=1 Tax=Hyaloscypha variabilis (strain UAMH 11265 / GT02V1 / F) TaxID=1149755 RepID=A0A2J6RIC1_HYAVF|nr:hypothetical protein L207DRAFT_585152 [Hyaloscypha variabilis F]